MSGPRSEQIKEALRTYAGPRDAAAILASAKKRYHARHANGNRDQRRKILEECAFLALMKSVPQLSGWAVKIDRPCRSQKIISICADRFGFTYSELMSRRRKLSLARARQVAMWMIWKSTRRSYPEIGRTMDRDHTTIMHGVWRVDKMMAEDEAFRERIEAILREVTPDDPMLMS